MELSYLYRPPPTENPFLRLQPNNQQPPTPPCPPVKNTFNPFRCQKSSTAEMETSTLPAHFLPPTTIPENPFLRRLPTPPSPPVRQTMNPFCCQQASQRTLKTLKTLKTWNFKSKTLKTLDFHKNAWKPWISTQNLQKFRLRQFSCLKSQPWPPQKIFLLKFSGGCAPAPSKYYW